MDEQLHEVSAREPEGNSPAAVGASASDSAELSREPDVPAFASDDSCEEAVPENEAPAGHRGMLAHAGRSAAALAVAGLAWVVPGLGHLAMRRWQRAAVFFVAVGGLAVSGLLMRGNVFHLHSEDPFGTLGFLADASSGVFYLLAHILERAGPNVARAMGDYGTRFIAGAGVVNLLGVCDAYEVARGRRH